jgi:hypothetical protein
MPYSNKYNVGFIRNSPVQWQNSQNGSKGYVEFSDWDSGVRANTLNAQAKLKGTPGQGGYTIINENNQKEQVNPHLGNGYANLPDLTRINTPPRTSSGGVENDGAFRGKYGQPGSDSYEYGQYYANVKKGMTDYINDPASGYSEADRQRVLGDLQNNRLNSRDAKSMEAYNAGIMRAEHSPSDYKEFLANRDKVRNGVSSALGEKVLDNAPPPAPGDNNKVPDKFKPKPEPEKQKEKDPIMDKVREKEREEWRKKNLERLMRMAGQENILNRLNQQ